MTDDVEAYERFLHDRLLVEQALTEKYRSKNVNSWDFGDGFYSADGYWNIDSPIGGGLEKQWTQQIDQLLAKRQDWEKPVVVMDFGSGFGTSLIRIGSKEEYRKAIEEGKLLLIATNLGYQPSDEADEDGYTLVAKSLNTRNKTDTNTLRDSDYLRFIQDNQSAVTYLDANVLELQDSAV